MDFLRRKKGSVENTRQKGKIEEAAVFKVTLIQRVVPAVHSLWDGGDVTRGTAEEAASQADPFANHIGHRVKLKKKNTDH